MRLLTIVCYRIFVHSIKPSRLLYSYGGSEAVGNRVFIGVSSHHISEHPDLPSTIRRGFWMMPLSMVAAAGPITMDAITVLGIGGAVAAILLILLLSFRELMTASLANPPLWFSSDTAKSLRSLDALIIPLFVVFALTVAFQVLEIIA